MSNRQDYEDEQQNAQRPPKKADVILKRQQEMAKKQDEALSQSNKRLDALMAEVATSRKASEQAALRSDELYNTLKNELKFIAAQNQSIFSTVSEELKKLEAEIEKLKTERQVAPAVQQEAAPSEAAAASYVEPVPVDVDYETLADMVAERIGRVPAYPVAESAEVDYDVLVDKIVARLPVQEAAVAAAPAAPAAIDYESLAERVANKISVPAPQVVESTTVTPVQPVQVNAEIDYDALAAKVAEKLPAPQVVSSDAPVTAQIDEEALAYKVAERLANTALLAHSEAAPAAVGAEIDYDLLADKVIARVPVQDAVSPDYIAAKVAEQLVIPNASAANVDADEIAAKVAERVRVPEAVQTELDYEALAKKVAEYIPVQVNAGESELNYERLAELISEYMPMQETYTESTAAPEAIDYDALAEKIAQKVGVPEAAAAVSNAEIDEEELADRIALKIGAINGDEYDIFVDDEGCETISREISQHLNYDEIASLVAEKLQGITVESSAEALDYEQLATLVAEKLQGAQQNNEEEELDYEQLAELISEYMPMQVTAEEELDYEQLATLVAEKLQGVPAENAEAAAPDYDEIATLVAERVQAVIENNGGEELNYDEIASRISENLSVASVNEDAIAEKAAAVLSNYMPEIDADELADKVAEQVIAAMQHPEVDSEAISNSVAEKLAARQEAADYEIILDENGIERVSERLSQCTEERFNAVESEIEEVRDLILNGYVVVRETEVASAQAVEEEVYEEEPEEELVTVSEVIADEGGEVEEVVEEVVEEQPAEETAEEVNESAVEQEEPDEEEDDEDENAEEETIAEFTYDELAGEEGPNGVDFANLMRYNRSFIARIIQSSDDVKNYYGEVRNALLSYKKVNFNLAWGAERFHKGRETIARFKIRGKTLVLYLALDPAAHEVTVYHHKDVSDNKSVAGTPMMVKIKSPRGVRKAVRLIDEMLEARNGEKRSVPQRDYAAMYPFETIEELIEEGLVKDVKKKK